MRANIEDDFIELNKPDEYNEVLPIIGTLALQNGNTARAIEVALFVDNTLWKEGFLNDATSFAMAIDEASEAVKALGNQAWLRSARKMRLIPKNSNVESLREHRNVLSTQIATFYMDGHAQALHEQHKGMIEARRKRGLTTDERHMLYRPRAAASPLC